MLKVAILVLVLGLLVLMGMALLNTEAQRTQIALLEADVKKLQGGPGSVESAGGARAMTFDATTPALFEAANAATPQLVAVQPRTGSASEIQLAVVTLMGVEGAGGVVQPVNQTLILQKGLVREVVGVCGAEAPAGAWIFVLEGSSLKIASRDCPYTHGGLRPQLKLTIVQ